MWAGATEAALDECTVEDSFVVGLGVHVFAVPMSDQRWFEQALEYAARDVNSIAPHANGMAVGDVEFAEFYLWGGELIAGLGLLSLTEVDDVLLAELQNVFYIDDVGELWGATPYVELHTELMIALQVNPRSLWGDFAELSDLFGALLYLLSELCASSWGDGEFGDAEKVYGVSIDNDYLRFCVFDDLPGEGDGVWVFEWEVDVADDGSGISGIQNLKGWTSDTILHSERVRRWGIAPLGAGARSLWGRGKTIPLRAGKNPRPRRSVRGWHYLYDP